MARKFVEAATFIFLQVIEQKPGIYEKCLPDCARRDKIDLAREKYLKRSRIMECMYTF
jgi:hypothetical protein